MAAGAVADDTLIVVDADFNDCAYPSILTLVNVKLPLPLFNVIGVVPR